MRTTTMTRAYGLWMSDSVEEYFNDHISIGTFRDYCDSSVFFNTITFDQKMMVDRKLELGLQWDDHSCEFDSFHVLYRMVCDRVIDKRWERPSKSRLRPFAFVALDFKGSRYGESFLNQENPHFHVIWALQPWQVPDFRQFVTSVYFKLNVCDRLLIDGWDLQPFDPRLASLKSLGSYAAKASSKSFWNPLTNTSIEIYGPDRKLHRAELRYRTRSRMLAKVWKALARDAR